MAALADALRGPLALAPNRVPRFYRGGRLLDEFRGMPEPIDSDRPEDWVGSATRTWTEPGRPPSPLGPSTVEVAGRQLTLDGILEVEPKALAGDQLVGAAGPTLGVLVKLLDAAERLPVHCHPSRADALAHLGSFFGKTEAWLILGTRDPAGATVWAGFARDVGLDELRGWIDRQDTAALLGALVAHRVATDDVLLIPAGVPHAIGAGVFLLELQEPTDFSIVAETRGFPIDEDAASLGLGWDTAIDMVERRPVGNLRQTPVDQGGGVTRLLGPDARAFFRAIRHRASGEAAAPFEGAYGVGVVLHGRGRIEGRTLSLDLARGVTFALPAAAVPEARLFADPGLDLVWCLGPDPGALSEQ